MEQKIATPPLEVKASIKLVRWVCLVSGIIHGIIKKRKYGAIERALREEEERERPAREARERCEKLRRDAAEMRELERIFLGTSSTETEENPNEIPCDGTIISKDDSSALNDKETETVIPPNGKSEETNDNVISKDKSEEAVKSEETNDKVVSKDKSEEAVKSEGTSDNVVSKNESEEAVTPLDEK